MTKLRCEICGEEGGEGQDTLGRIDDSINDHKTVHLKCWNRDPEAKQWTALDAVERVKKFLDTQ